jgi:iron complex outermembrane receptor protein
MKLREFSFWLPLFLVPLLLSPATAAELAGTVFDADSREPVEFAYVLILDENDTAQGALYTDEKGLVEFRSIAPGTYTLVLGRIGYEEVRLEGIEVSEGVAESLSVEMVAVPYVVAPIVVTASRSREMGIRSARSTSVVDSTRVEEAIQFTPTEVVRTEPQIDFRRKGLIQTTINNRDNARQGNLLLLVLQDYRFTALPALELNFSYLQAAGTGDVERIEIARGPSSALYGPDGATGVLHVITRSPLDKQGTTFSITGGEKSVFQGWMRHAGVLSDKVGYKLSGEYFRGEDWKWDHPDATHDIERATGEARIDWRPSTETSLIVSGGSAYVFELTDQAPAALFQANDLRYNYAQTRFHHGRGMVNVMFNANHTGSTTNLITGLPLIDKSRMFASQVQYGNTLQLGSRMLDLTYGLDHRTTLPETGGTLHGRHEDNDTITEAGAYVQGKTVVSSQFDVIGALRADFHDRMNDVYFSPRFGLVYQPTPEHALRTTYNRSFSTLTALLLFQDFAVAGAPPYQWFFFSVPKSGLSYRFDCGGPCMRSAYVPGGLDQYGASDATRTWEAIQQQHPDLAAIGPPSSSEVGTNLRRLDPERGFQHLPVTPGDIQTIEQAGRSYTETIEVGYKGFVTERLQLGADVFTGRGHNATRDVSASTNVFYDEDTLEQYLIDQNMSPQMADSLAQVIAGDPVGTINPEQVGASSDLYLVSEATEETFSWGWGAALNLDFRLTREFKLAANYIWKEWEPENRAAGRLHYDHAESGVSSYFQVRYRDRASDDNLGIWSGSVDSYVIFDFNLRYRPRWARNIELSLTANNVFDNMHQQIVGAPEIGRLILTRLRVDL